MTLRADRRGYGRLPAWTWIGPIAGAVAVVCMWGGVMLRGGSDRVPAPGATGMTEDESARVASGEPAQMTSGESAEPAVFAGQVFAPRASANARLEAMWGIKPVGLMLSLGGRVLDFRFTVVAPAKAGEMAYREDCAYLIDEKTGNKLFLPRMARTGAMRQTLQEMRTGRQYSIMFSNPRNMVKAGDRLTLAIGDIRVEGLSAQ